MLAGCLFRDLARFWALLEPMELESRLHLRCYVASWNLIWGNSMYNPCLLPCFFSMCCYHLGFFWDKKFVLFHPSFMNCASDCYLALYLLLFCRIRLTGRKSLHTSGGLNFRIILRVYWRIISRCFLLIICRSDTETHIGRSWCPLYNHSTLAVLFFCSVPSYALL